MLGQCGKKYVSASILRSHSVLEQNSPFMPSGLCLGANEASQKEGGKERGMKGEKEGGREEICGEAQLSLPSLSYIKYKTKPINNSPIGFSGIS